jgi:phenylpyruvate tautomerase PptA (4-oxalocrotonate tautomerase family)
MPWVEITTREPLADDVRANLARSISDTMETIEFGHPTEKARKIDWMWFHTLPANMWAVGGQFDDTYVRGRKLAFARIVAPEGFMNSELKARALSEVAKNIREALAVGPDDDATGIWVVCTEERERHWLVGNHTTPLLEIVDMMEGDVSQGRRDEMKALFDGQARLKDTFGIPK